MVQTFDLNMHFPSSNHGQGIKLSLVHRGSQVRAGAAYGCVRARFTALMGALRALATGKVAAMDEDAGVAGEVVESK